MTQRIITLVGYLLYRLATSLVGAGYVAIGIAYYMFAFQTVTPEADYFILVIGLFGALITFLIGLSISSKANEAASYPILVRLNSRVEYVTAVFLATLLSGLVLQLILAAVALLRNDPVLTARQVLEIPPVWLSLNILFAVLALHASDFIAAGWSRVSLFGFLAILLVGSDTSETVMHWLADRAQQASAWAYQRGSAEDGQFLQSAANWLSADGTETVQNLFGFLFWPFQAIIDGTILGGYSRVQALGPAVLLLYATILFMLAADIFAMKDIYLTEE